MQKLARDNAAMVLDALTARMRFERTGVKLYDEVIRKIERSAQPRYHAVLDTLRKHRDEEREHEVWLEGQIRALGGYPEQETTLSKLEAQESTGIASVILDGHNEILHLLHALLAAEAADNAGWDLLVQLADDAGDTIAKMQLAKRLAEEVKHLAYLREVIHAAAEIEILGIETSLPRSPTAALAPKAIKPLVAGLGALGIVGGAVAGTLLVRRALAS